MWRWTRRLTVGLVLLLVVAATGGAVFQWVASRNDLAATPPPGRMVDVGGHRLHIWCIGSGDPVVVLDAGLGGSSFGSHLEQTHGTRRRHHRRGSPERPPGRAHPVRHVHNGVVLAWRVREWTTVVGADAATPVRPADA